MGVTRSAVPVETVQVGAYSSIDEREEAVAQNPEEWRELWERHAPDDPIPAVDFSRHQVAAVFAGRLYGGEARVQLAILSEPSSPNLIKINYAVIEPPRDPKRPLSASIVSAPFAIVALPKYLRIRFQSDNERRGFPYDNPNAPPVQSVRATEPLLGERVLFD